MNTPIKESVYIIIPVHNRKNITLKCLETLKKQGDLERYYVIIVDDGSTDGTSEAIYSLYPDVIVLKGDGNLWWTGAIKKGMEYAYKQGAEYFIWLNDDTLPAKNSINYLVQNCSQSSQTISCGQCYNNANLDISTYGGHQKQKLSLKLLFANLNEIIKCDCLSGNFVCFPRSIVEKIGFPDANKFPHSFADLVYTWTAKQIGYNLNVLGSATAVCQFNPLESNWSLSPIPMKERWKIINTPKSNFYPPAYWNYCQIFYGSLAIIVFMRSYLILVLFTILRWLFPIQVIERLKNMKKQLFVD